MYMHFVFIYIYMYLAKNKHVHNVFATFFHNVVVTLVSRG